MPATYKILIMGASYGSLLASKILYGGHSVHLVCLPAEADLINAEGFRVRMPVKGRKDQVEIDSRKLPGKVSAGGAAGVNPKDYDLVGLAMQEPQYRSPGVRELLDAVAKSKVPCMSIMNMPPLPYVKRIPGLNYDALKPAYTDPTVWDNFEPGLLTLCSPDPQAIRPPEEKVNVLQVTLPTNFKVARFDNDMHTGILRQLEKDIDAVRFDAPEGKIELPVKLRVHDSIFVPLAKWSMLLAGNYRCITKDGMRTAQEAVHSNHRGVALGLQFRVRSLRQAWRIAKRPGAVREIRRRGAKSDASGLGRARFAERRAQYRTRRQAGAADRQAKGPQPPGDRRDRRAGRLAARGQPQKGGSGLMSELQRGRQDVENFRGERSTRQRHSADAYRLTGRICDIHATAGIFLSIELGFA